jgi:hypothetical protein
MGSQKMIRNKYYNLLFLLSLLSSCCNNTKIDLTNKSKENIKDYYPFYFPYSRIKLLVPNDFPNISFTNHQDTDCSYSFMYKGNFTKNKMEVIVDSCHKLFGFMSFSYWDSSILVGTNTLKDELSNLKKPNNKVIKDTITYLNQNDSIFEVKSDNSLSPYHYFQVYVVSKKGRYRIKFTYQVATDSDINYYIKQSREVIKSTSNF